MYTPPLLNWFDVYWRLRNKIYRTADMQCIRTKPEEEWVEVDGHQGVAGDTGDGAYEAETRVWEPELHDGKADEPHGGLQHVAQRLVVADDDGRPAERHAHHVEHVDVVTPEHDQRVECEDEQEEPQLQVGRRVAVLPRIDVEHRHGVTERVRHAEVALVSLRRRRFRLGQ